MDLLDNSSSQHPLSTVFSFLIRKVISLDLAPPKSHRVKSILSPPRKRARELPNSKKRRVDFNRCAEVYLFERTFGLDKVPPEGLPLGMELHHVDFELQPIDDSTGGGIFALDSESRCSIFEEHLPWLLSDEGRKWRDGLLEIEHVRRERLKPRPIKIDRDMISSESSPLVVLVQSQVAECSPKGEIPLGRSVLFYLASFFTWLAPR
eukprot:TRINITY_DN9803_c0_g1_i1.p1 TRINITY_DN9803_c0_g1~~TRINITY_DN9803_c0_g1_i1.p1  ORF type:complete len:207 (-),score=18.48 TRINITY_DN9803_c0_g1_i1:2-622(-)